ncbi:UDP-glucuronosyltransferase 2B17-like [Dipodomys spectabilis]|uniref:UDP-glucuronosyltransferase 2B17-like n=1 Tax=Dipodomys spectabilis TaxID=105255 RepID=UPI001C541631|nr:UDP-glucuronosyltransferase 2B17-like [Dipodomys spectabilis]
MRTSTGSLTQAQRFAVVGGLKRGAESPACFKGPVFDNQLSINVLASFQWQVEVVWALKAICLACHPKTKAFITHGGAKGVYEAIHHGIPMVGIPLFGEQRDNIAHMVAKGAADQLDIRAISRKDLLRALESVIHKPFYKKNAMWLSTIHHDQPMKPLDPAVFWIEFVMCHKGAKHLRPLSHNLAWYQYHSLDVIRFLLACVATVTFLLLNCCLLVCQKVFKMRKKKKK